MKTPPQWLEPVHHPAYGRLLCAFLRSRNCDPDEALRAAGLTWPLLVREERYLSQVQMAALIDAAMRITGCAALGLEVSRVVQPVAHGEVGTAVVTSSTLLKALQASARYASLRTRALRFEFRSDAHEGRLTVAPAFDLGPTGPTIIELTVMNAINVIGAAFGYALEPIALDLPYPPPAWRDRYREFLPGTVRFSQRVAALCVPASALATPSLTADSIACAAASDSCERALAYQKEGRGSDRARVRAALLVANGPLPTLAETASRFAMSPRTLIRRLKDSGTSYQALRDETRRELALWYLERTDESIAAIAERLGYVDASNFSSVFRRWCATTPTRHRRQVRDQRGSRTTSS